MAKGITITTPKVPGLTTRRRGGGRRSSPIGGLGKKPIIKGIPNTYLAGGALVTVGGVAGLYYLQGQGLLPEWFPQLPVLPGFEGLFSAFALGNVANVTLQVYPNIVAPNATVNITGTAEDDNGNAVIAPKLYYYVYEDLASAGQVTRTLVDHGVAGELTSNYTKTLATTNYRDGTYTVYVSDKPLSEDPGATTAVTTGSNIGGATYPDQSGFDATIS